MTGKDGLFLHEEIMLLALRDDEGTIPIGSQHQFAIGGALIAELLLNNRVKIGEPAKKKMIDLVDATPLGDPILDECLEKATSQRTTVLEGYLADRSDSS